MKQHCIIRKPKPEQKGISFLEIYFESENNHKLFTGIGY